MHPGLKSGRAFQLMTISGKDRRFYFYKFIFLTELPGNGILNYNLKFTIQWV